mmetsp:Transcript_114653/g.244596  ORF Transcript_114653/g.244596 Transcript_114653/m.244596 type:complete len:346 (-) Transcript_114653:288-1325(-)
MFKSVKVIFTGRAQAMRLPSALRAQAQHSLASPLADASAGVGAISEGTAFDRTAGLIESRFDLGSCASAAGQFDPNHREGCREAPRVGAHLLCLSPTFSRSEEFAVDHSGMLAALGLPVQDGGNATCSLVAEGSATPKPAADAGAVPSDGAMVLAVETAPGRLVVVAIFRCRSSGPRESRSSWISARSPCKARCASCRTARPSSSRRSPSFWATSPWRRASAWPSCRSSATRLISPCSVATRTATSCAASRAPRRRRASKPSSRGTSAASRSTRSARPSTRDRTHSSRSRAVSLKAASCSLPRRPASAASCPQRRSALATASSTWLRKARNCCSHCERASRKQVL